ncbi:hypothetical protein KC19_8G030800 [Ceratodon purpureus]|uniref:Protein kinase domain-containing protein n=1 Tax=Ceratodon purpureus TaxID=3225 RepID=A0A8T0GUM2_CERPU|nr:hypothetical protein KC19_8G030800 [Ceratodon purpureus]
MAGFSLELARLTGTSERWPSGRLNELVSEDAINQLCSQLVDTMELDSSEKDTGSQLCSYLDSIELDEQFLRLLADQRGRGPSWRIVQDQCKLAYLSQSFYRCISDDQWLRTVIEAKSTVIEAESTVVEAESTVIEAESTVIEAESTVIEAESTVIEAESTVIEAESTVIEAESTVIEAESTVIEAESTVIEAESTVIEAESTVIEAESTVIEAESTVIHSNVVPQQAYLRRVEDVMATCTGNECNGGFFPTSLYCELGERPSQSCTNCALAEQLRVRSLAQTSGAVARSWYLMEEKDVSLVDNHHCVGKGSEGAVYKILWREGIFAQKVFKCDFDGSETPRQCVSFINEIDVAKEISHPNIVHSFGYGYAIWDEDGEHYYGFSVFMELLDEDLHSHLVESDRKNSGFSFRDTLHILLQIAEAMEHLHEKNFVHGDLKPGNILMSQLPMPHSDAIFYLVKVADFGCAQQVDSVSGATVQPFNSKAGTTRYSAPEVLRCRNSSKEAPPKYPQKVDVYSFGVVAFQVLTGATTDNIFKDFRKDNVMRPDGDKLQWRPDCHFDLGTLEPDRLSLLNLVKRCWASSPESRPTFTEICRELQSPIRSSKA